MMKQKSLKNSGVSFLRYGVPFYIFFLAMLIAPAVSVSADILDKAVEYAGNGETLAARNCYVQWLSNNIGDTRYDEIIKRLYELVPDVNEAAETIIGFMEKTDTPDDLYLMLSKSAELSGQISKAIFYTKRGLEKNPENAELNFLAARLYFKLGDYDNAKSHAYNLMLERGDEKFQLGGVSIAAIILGIQGEYETAFALLNKAAAIEDGSTAAIIGTQLLLSKMEGDREKIERYSDVLKEKYPDSIDLISAGDTSRYLDVVLLLSTQPNGTAEKQGITEISSDQMDMVRNANGRTVVHSAESSDSTVDIQIGSYAEKENAERRRKDQRLKDYKTSIREVTINGNHVFRVVIESVHRESVQRVLLELKEKGIEAFPVY